MRKNKIIRLAAWLIAVACLCGCGSGMTEITPAAKSGVPVRPKTPFREYELTQEGTYLNTLEYLYANDREIKTSRSGAQVFTETNGSVILLSRAPVPTGDEETMLERIAACVSAGILIEDINLGITDETTEPLSNDCQITIGTHGTTIKNEFDAVWFDGVLTHYEQPDEDDEGGETGKDIIHEYYTCGYLFPAGDASFILAGVSTKEGRDRFATSAIILEVDKMMENTHLPVVEEETAE